ncbi:hypothetical protein D081_1845 [Anaerovibrio sp. JC8]|nr:hypothetical protein D081_1845 [Anaerovibrio sp. JC8]
MVLGSVFLTSKHQSGELVEQLPEPNKTILLIPLDSRPPCGRLVADNARTVGINILMPPGEAMDFYSLPGETTKTREWLSKEIKNCQEAIISIDQLLYGGLIASRNKAITDEQISALTDYLKKLHAENPTVRIHAFAILPRMNPPDFVEKYQDRKKIMKWSRLVHQYDNQPLSETADQIQELEREIPSDLLRAYKEIYNRNLRLNRQLADLLAEGILTELTFGQDDGEAYSLPNLKLKEFRHYIEKKNIPRDRLAIIHGADEAALSILTNIVAEQQSFRVYIDYSSPQAAQSIMPYMAISNDETARERLHFHHSLVVDSPEEADYILFVSANNEETMDTRKASLRKMQDYRQANKPIALVDLSENFTAAEALFPVLLQANYPVNSLAAYAGWNTASNAIGTAIAQAEIYLTALKDSSKQDAVVCSNIINLNNRFCEDYYYLKDVIDLVNANLRKKGYGNVNDLDLEHNYKWAVDMAESTMRERLVQYKYSPAFKQPFSVKGTQYAVRDLTMELYFPWPRTFEVNLSTAPALIKMKN